jgi:hypothetical protein
MNKKSKVILCFNIAGLIYGTRWGFRNAARKLALCYDLIDPFGEGKEISSAETINKLSLIPQSNIENIVKIIPVVRIDARQTYVDGALPQKDLMGLLSLLIDWGPDVVVEIGTFNGATTAAMALNAPNAMIHTVDLPLDYQIGKETTVSIPKDDFHLILGRKVGEAYKSLSGVNNITQHLVDSAIWDFEEVKGATFFFIDGSHTYEYAKNDTEKCMAVASSNARFVLHDCDERHPGVVDYVFELMKKGIPVTRIKNTSIVFFDKKN